VQEADSADDPRQLFSGDAQWKRFSCTDADEERIMFPLECRPVDIFSKDRIAEELRSHLEDRSDIGINDLQGKTKAGYSITHHAAGFCMGVDYGDPVTCLKKVISGRQSGRPGSDDGDLLS